MKKILLILVAAFALSPAKAQDTVFTLNALPVPDTGFYNGSDGKGYFADTVGNVWVKFYNSYDSAWNSWQGWAYSTWKDDTAEGSNNQWSAYPGYLIDSTFALAYIGIDWNDNYKNIPAGIKFSQPIEPLSIYVANTTYTALVIKKGNSFAQAFGPGDYLKLIIVGLIDNQPTDTITHFLADYRGGISFIQKDWAYVDLSSLGRIDSISFNLISTDTGKYGMNTPGYFAMDMLRFIPVSQTTIVHTSKINSGLTVYPNPASSYFNVPQSTKLTEAFNLHGQKVGQWTQHTIHISHLPDGLYILRMWNGGQWHSQKIIIRH